MTALATTTCARESYLSAAVQDYTVAGLPVRDIIRIAPARDPPGAGCALPPIIRFSTRPSS